MIGISTEGCFRSASYTMLNNNNGISGVLVRTIRVSQEGLGRYLSKGQLQPFPVYAFNAVFLPAQGA